MSAITVIIPSYNAECCIGEALSSVQKQTSCDVEVIVIDDGSIDRTVQEAEGFSSKLDLTILQQKNAGPAAARNAGIRMAQGQYCAFLDADDVMLPERLEAQSALLKENSDLGLVYTDLMTFDDGGIIHKTRRVFSEPCAGMVLDRLLLQNFITTSTVMAPKECLLEVGLFDEGRRISEDFELWLRMAARWKVGFIDRPLVLYRRRPGSLSYDKLVSARARMDVIEVFWQRHPDYLRGHRKVYCQSLARAMATAGAAALLQRRRCTALGYLLRSLGHDPWAPAAWKWLLKSLVLPLGD